MHKEIANGAKSNGLPPLDDDEFCVSITRAAQLSNLSESQIRYLENLPGVVIGRRRPKERNRVYTKQDIQLLRWIGAQNLSPARIAERLKDEQAEILDGLGHITLEQVTLYEQEASGLDVLISRLVATMMAIWNEASLEDGIVSDAVIEGVIFGPQDSDWQEKLSESLEYERAINLKDALVAWSTLKKEELQKDPNAIFGNLHILFPHQSLYLPFEQHLLLDTARLADTSLPFSIVLLWSPTSEGSRGEESIIRALKISQPKKQLLLLLLRTLKRVLSSTPPPLTTPLSIYSHGSIGLYSLSRGLALLLEKCIKPYFPNCFLYVGKLEHNGQLSLLEERGEKVHGYLPEALRENKLPWWINFARDRAGLALVENSPISHQFHQGERGSAICFPLIVLDQVVGVLGIEKVDVKGNTHCLTPFESFSGSELLRYLICISEIAAEYLNLGESSVQKAERSKLAYKSDETINWWLDIYHYGGLNYIKAIERIWQWAQDIGIGPDETIHLILIDIHREDLLAAKYQGFEIVVDLVRNNARRIREQLENDPVLKTRVAQQRLLFIEEPVGEHLLLANRHNRSDWGYMPIFLERIMQFWRGDGDKFYWKKVEIDDAALQVGVCHFPGLMSYEQDVALSQMNHFLAKLVGRIQKLDEQQPLTEMIEITATLPLKQVEAP